MCDFMIPKVKKKLSSFLLSEEGKISKQSLLSLGAFMSAAVIGGILATKEAAATHTNSLDVAYSDGTATGTHAHHSSHSSHGSHGSHGSHSSHGSHGSHGSHSSHGSHGSHSSHSSHANAGDCACACACTGAAPCGGGACGGGGM